MVVASTHSQTHSTSSPRARGGAGSGVVLATDLDGTFLGGTDADRDRLYTLLRESERDTLIFATGRGLETILPLLADPLVPRPRYIIADVGATVVRGDTLDPVQPIQSEIDARWPGMHRVMSVLDSFGGLVRQDVPQERRASFYLEDTSLIPDIAARVETLGCEVLHSAGCYLDVLPGGVNKGTTLQRLVRNLGIEDERVVVAGDTANDIALFDTGYRGVAVGNADEQLKRHVRDLPRVVIAEAHGAGGVLEGLKRHGFGAAGVHPFESLRQGQGSADLVMVYHRLPFAESRSGGKTRRRAHKSPNGIIPTLLDFFADGTKGSWVASSEQDSRGEDTCEIHEAVDKERYPNLTVARVPLTRQDIHTFYERFSKEAFWPVIFSFPSKAVFKQEHWEHYREINEAFAERAAKEAAEGATVWVHDYNLWLVPGLLRQRRPDVKIAFFHHTAFPPSDIFNIVPWRREILGSLLQCDYVGFHIPKYIENFVDCVRSHAPLEVLGRKPCAPRFLTYGCAMGTDTVTTAIRVQEHTVRLGAHPVGIDLDKVGRILLEPRSQEQIQQLKDELQGRRCVLSVERLDYVKGPLEKLRAFEMLLEEHPELRGKVVLISVCTPPAPGMQVYKQTRAKVDEAVGRINGRFSELSWTPVRYFYRSLPYEEVVAHYAVADVAWITPLRDGLNLVAKEYVATRRYGERDGALLLSEFAGAAAELHGALLTNPYDPEDLKNKLYQALTLHPENRRAQMSRLVDIVAASDLASWGAEFLRAVRDGE